MPSNSLHKGETAWRLLYVAEEGKVRVRVGIRRFSIDAIRGHRSIMKP